MTVGDGFRFGLGWILAQILWLPLLMGFLVGVVVLLQSMGRFPAFK